MSLSTQLHFTWMQALVSLSLTWFIVSSHFCSSLLVPFLKSPVFSLLIHQLCFDQWASLVAQTVKEPTCNAIDQGLIPRLARSSPGGGNGNPLQYSCFRNLMDRGAWQATVRHYWVTNTHSSFVHLGLVHHKPLLIVGIGNRVMHSCGESLLITRELRQDFLKHTYYLNHWFYFLLCFTYKDGIFP